MTTDSGQALVSSQRWKLWLWGIAVAAIVVCFLASRPIAAVVGVDSAAVTLAATFGGLVVLVGAALSLTCAPLAV